MGAHGQITPLPVDHSFDRGARIGKDRPRLDDMKGLAVFPNRVDDFHGSTVPGDGAHVAGLAPTPRVENGAVQEQPAFRYVENVPLGMREIGVLGC